MTAESGRSSEVVVICIRTPNEFNYVGVTHVAMGDRFYNVGQMVFRRLHVGVVGSRRVCGCVCACVFFCVVMRWGGRLVRRGGCFFRRRCC
jgi:hypothetical protein